MGRLAEQGGAPSATLAELSEHCEVVYRKLVPAAAVTLVMTALMSLFIWPLRPEGIVVFWQAMMVVFSAGTLAIAFAYRRPGRAADPATWTKRAGLAAAALGAGWGFAAAVFFPGRQEEQVVLCFAIVLAATGGLPFFSAVWPIYALYGATALIPFTVVLFTYGDDFFRMLAAVVPLLYVANVWTARELSRELTAARRARGAYQRLAVENEDVQAQLGEQLDSLLDAHREVRDFGRKLSLFSERAPIAVFEVDPAGTVLSVNPAAENLFGWAASELTGRNIVSMIFSSDDDHERTGRWWADLVSKGAAQTVAVERCMRRDGLALACEWTLTPLASEKGDGTTFILQGRDITQQRAAERLRSEFTSTLSHELRTPLTSMLGSLELLRGGVMGDLRKEQDDVAEIAERNGRRLLDLINEVLDIEKIESGRLTLTPEPLALAELIGESLRLNQGFADRFQVRLAAPGLLPEVTVRADRKRLMQVMTNLLSNAAKFSPPGTPVEVRVRTEGATVRIEVSDRGPGIPPEFRGRIFGRFAQAHSVDSRVKGGSGLGLAISKRLVELMDGHIGFEDRPGGGTTFYFDLPILQSQPVHEEHERVLVTDEDLVVSEYFAMVLEKGGFKVDIVPDTIASRDLLGRWTYAAWLLSSHHFAGAEALGILAGLRSSPRGAPAVVVVGAGKEHSSANGKMSGVSGWLTKNESRDRIVGVVRDAIAGLST